MSVPHIYVVIHRTSMRTRMWAKAYQQNNVRVGLDFHCLQFQSNPAMSQNKTVISYIYVSLGA